MADVTQPPSESFRLSQLIYDTRYRSLTIQAVAMALIILMLSWLVSNTVQNLEALGKDFDFGFLDARAGYDINQRLIAYDSSSTHGRAALVGILNTLLVAFLGCLLATVLGVIVGVLRLSKNWVVGMLMSFYVEAFRNVPLLLWILVVFAVMTEGMPQPRDFRAAPDGTSESSMLFNDSVAVTNRGVYIPKLVFSNSLAGPPVAPAEEEAAAQSTVGVTNFGASRIATGSAGVATGQDAPAAPAPTVATPRAAVTEASGEPLPRSSVYDWLLILGVLAAGVVGVRAIRAWAGRTQEATGLRPRTWWMQIGLIVVPVGIVLWALGAQWAKPELSGFNFDGGIHLRNSLIALWLALSLYTAAFIAEIVRGGILAISRGQTEAAFALGLRPNRTMSLVILPQALRVIIPPLISQYLNLTKNSSLAIAVGYMDVRSTLGGITINQTGRELEGMLLLGAFYLVTSLVISAVMNVYNSSVKLKER
jgi:general L-amino acid transport system permease protein